MREQVFNIIVYLWIALAISVVPLGLVITAPYGRHRSHKWGPGIDNRAGWIIMEAASPIAFAGTMLACGGPSSPPVWLFLALWIAHYINRTLVYPMRIRTSGKFIPLAIVIASIGFNAINGWLNGYYLASPWASYPGTWFADPKFIVGLAIFVAGAAINLWADNRLIALRRNSDTGYLLPRGGLFELVSCPNHLGEIVEWAGFALMCWNLPAASFAIWTAANLGPRALSHHRWYKRQFPDYPASRSALVPFLL